MASSCRSPKPNTPGLSTLNAQLCAVLCSALPPDLYKVDMALFQLLLLPSDNPDFCVIEALELQKRLLQQTNLIENGDDWLFIWYGLVWPRGTDEP